MTEPLFIEIYPMAGDTIADTYAEITAWDILVRPDGGDPVEEIEDIATYDQCCEAIAALESKYPNAGVDWSIVELLS